MQAHPLSLHARDLGVVLALVACQRDSWSTRFQFRVVESPFAYTVGGATLSVVEGEGLEGATLGRAMPLIRVEAAGDTGWMVFGPLPEDAAEVILTVDRMQVPSDPERPDVYLNPFLDPFEEEDDPEVARALEARYQSDRGLRYDLPPAWECTGAWAFRVTLPPPTVSGRALVDAWAAIGSHALRVAWIDRGALGTLVALDMLPADIAAHGEHFRDHLLNALRAEGTCERPAFRVQVRADGDARESGPYGVFGVRHYLELGPGDVTALSCQDLRGVPLAEPVSHCFEPRRLEDDNAFRFSLDCAGFEGDAYVELTDVYDNGSSMVLSYNIVLDAPDVASAWPHDAVLVDPIGVEHLLQGDGVHYLDPERPLRGLLFPSPTQAGTVELRITSLDLSLRQPMEIPLEGLVVQ
ncbi:MAG: hypothetical protein FJX76_05640 [Armatimonadetes bacterium]|nr:hypothetical protein [Armatimonadota bacterium]